MDVLGVGEGLLLLDLDALLVGLRETGREVGGPAFGDPASGGALLAGQDVGEDLGDRGAAVDLLPLLDQGGPDALFESALLAEAAGGVAHQDGRGPTGRSLKVLDEGVGGGGDVAQGAVEEVDLLFLVHDHAAVDGAAQVVGLQALAQVALVAGGDAVEQAGDLVDEDVGVGRHRLEAGHGGLVALEGVPHELEH